MQFKDEIIVPISKAPFTNKDRIARHESFVIFNDLNMVQQVNTHYVNEAGVLIHDLIDADLNLTPAQKELAKAQYPTRLVSKTTEGAFCESTTGAVVPPGTPGAVPQLDFFQNITVGQMMALTGTTKTDSFAQVLYTMLAGEIQKIDARGEL